MKIIKKGENPKEKKYRSTCYNCKTVVEFIAKEAKATYDQRDGNFLSIKCPVCGEMLHETIR